MTIRGMTTIRDVVTICGMHAKGLLGLVDTVFLYFIGPLKVLCYMWLGVSGSWWPILGLGPLGHWAGAGGLRCGLGSHGHWGWGWGAEAPWKHEHLVNMVCKVRPSPT